MSQNSVRTTLTMINLFASVLLAAPQKPPLKPEEKERRKSVEVKAMSMSKEDLIKFYQKHIKGVNESFMSPASDCEIVYTAIKNLEKTKKLSPEEISPMLQAMEDFIINKLKKGEKGEKGKLSATDQYIIARNDNHDEFQRCKYEMALKPKTYNLDNPHALLLSLNACNQGNMYKREDIGAVAGRSMRSQSLSRQ